MVERMPDGNATDREERASRARLWLQATVFGGGARPCRGNLVPAELAEVVKNLADQAAAEMAAQLEQEYRRRIDHG